MKKHIKDDPSKVLFLDIDGVLNSDEFFSSKYHDRLLLSRGEHGTLHDPRACALLGKIKKATNCKIVMSSSWRCFYFSKDKKAKFLAKPLKKELKKNGIIIRDKTSYEYDKDYNTKYLNWFRSDDTKPFKVEKFFDRGLQIQCYLKRHPEIKNFVILDDSDVDLFLFGDNFIQTNPRTGLTEKDVEKAIRMLIF
jgi:hypothetical protein